MQRTLTPSSNLSSSTSLAEPGVRSLWRATPICAGVRPPAPCPARGKVVLRGLVPVDEADGLRQLTTSQRPALRGPTWRRRPASTSLPAARSTALTDFASAAATCASVQSGWPPSTAMILSGVLPRVSTRVSTGVSQGHSCTYSRCDGEPGRGFSDRRADLLHATRGEGAAEVLTTALRRQPRWSNALAPDESPDRESGPQKRPSWRAPGALVPCSLDKTFLETQGRAF